MKKFNDILFKAHKTLSPMEDKIVDELLKYKGLRFKTNYTVGYYSIDVAFPEYKQGLEIDGKDYHNTEDQTSRDDLRTKYLEEEHGWHIERVPGWLVYRNPQVAAIKILRFVTIVHDNPIYKQGVIQAKQWFMRELLNEGDKTGAKQVMDSILRSEYD